MDLQAEMDDFLRRYERAWVQGDFEGLSDLFKKDAVMMPFIGGTYEGAEAIGKVHEAAFRPKSFQAHSVRTERFGDMIMNVGTVTLGLPDEEGGGSMEWEYVVLLEQTDDGLKIHRLISFPTRKPVGASQ
jgi:uncharacterized protein (TIGR02246 family)